VVWYCAAIVGYFFFAKNGNRWRRWWMSELTGVGSNTEDIRRWSGANELAFFFFGVEWIGRILDSAQYSSFSLTLHVHAISHHTLNHDTTEWCNCIFDYMWEEKLKRKQHQNIIRTAHILSFLYGKTYERWKWH